MASVAAVATGKINIYCSHHCVSKLLRVALPLLSQVIFDCMALHSIATRLRSARFGSGALRLTNTKLSFALDTGGNPVSTSAYVQAEANHLVEEFMLLANMRVAGIIARAFPKHALLRWACCFA